MISKSPERHTFQDTNEELHEFWANIRAADEKKFTDPAWQKDNLEHDLRSTDWILEKVRVSEQYAQNLYAALCNNEFQINEVWPLLKGQKWSCSWRHAGGIIADMREQGDYIDWYCSGIGSAEEGFGLGHASGECYVGEGHVTDEIAEDLFKLGWIVNNREKE